jgi:hypothetical protein
VRIEIARLAQQQAPNLINLTNPTNTPLKFTEGPGDGRVIQREFYGITVQAGVNYKLGAARAPAQQRGAGADQNFEVTPT